MNDVMFPFPRRFLFPAKWLKKNSPSPTDTANVEKIAKSPFLNEFNENKNSKPMAGNQNVNQISKFIAAAVFAVTTPTKHPANVIEKS